MPLSDGDVNMIMKGGVHQRSGPIKALLVGNGFSRRFDENYNYTSLMEKCSDDEIKKLSESFKTNNFEFLMNNLQIAQKALDTFGEKINNDELFFTNKYLHAREIFIKTINSTVEFSRNKLRSKLSNIGKFLLGFDCVFTLNYDPIIYWALMDVSPPSSINHKPFGDWFYYSNESRLIEFDYNREVFRKCCNSERDLTLLYYLHGSLFLVYNNNITRKTSGDEFIDNNDEYSYIRMTEVSKQIVEDSTNDYKYLIVSEGTHKEKKQLIDKNDYLNFCLENLSSISNIYSINKDEPNTVDLCILGFSANEEADKHIIDALSKNNNTRFTLCVYKDTKDVEEGIEEDKLRKYAEENYQYLLKTIRKNSKDAEINIYDITKDDNPLGDF